MRSVSRLDRLLYRKFRGYLVAGENTGVLKVGFVSLKYDKRRVQQFNIPPRPNLKSEAPNTEVFLLNQPEPLSSVLPHISRDEAHQSAKYTTGNCPEPLVSDGVARSFSHGVMPHYLGGKLT
ncbi:hypothetical protein RRG08_045437 [Elysia crispata]|uniref:Uncharacterized protein n=1 Tax=Elysia crispata TaxID=231223 RepID=A0AAE1AYZ2_9GAST|nr:hypothetical protein RRG08_045437 [Elysia crispata]